MGDDILISELSCAGTRHKAAHVENQDVVCHGFDGKLTVISLADGVSTCEMAREGAEIASREITELLLKKGDYFMEFSSEQIAEFALSHMLYELERRASEDSREPEEYSSTIGSVLLDSKNGRMLCFSLGDSIIMATKNGECRVLVMPSDSTSGCCVTTTENAKDMVTAKVMDTEDIESVMICSDGAWRQMFAGGKLRAEAASLIAVRDFDGLKKFLKSGKCEDDYSFVAVNIS